MTEELEQIDDLEHVPLRLTCRLELLWKDQTTSGILQEISLKEMIFRAPMEIPQGQLVTVKALPTIQDEITFPVTVSVCQYQEEDEGNLQYHSITATNSEDTPDYWNFMRKLYLTVAQMNERIRIGCRIPVVIGTQDWQRKMTGINISKGGMFVHQDAGELPQKGLMVKFKLGLGNKVVVAGQGEIVHRVNQATADSLGVPSGLGVQFKDFATPEDQDALAEYIDEQFRRAVVHQRHQD